MTKLMGWRAAAAGHRWAIDSDPIRRCGTGGPGSCEVLAFDEGTMLRIGWTAAETMRDLASTVTFTLTSGNPLAAGSGWARMDVDATTPTAAESRSMSC